MRGHRAWLLMCVALPASASEIVGGYDGAYARLAELQRRGVLLGALAPGHLVEIEVPEGTIAAREFEALRALHVTGERPTLRLRLEAQTLARASDPERQLRPGHLDPREDGAVDSPWRERLSLIADARLHPAVRARLRFALDSDGRNDPRTRTRDFEQLGASNNFDEAWLGVDAGPARITLGRVPMDWGPTRGGSLLLGPATPALDAAHFAFGLGRLRLQSFVAQLSSESPVDGPPIRRWLYGHRADLWLLGDRVRVGLAETALVAGPSEGLNLRYLNPVPLWAQIQVERDGDASTQANVFDAIDGEARVELGRLRLRPYGSLVVDDLQIDPEGRERSPDQLAWAAGLDLSPLAGDAWLLGYEYRRVGSWTYLHRGQGTDYQHYELPLGAPEGPDADRHSLRADLRVGARWRLWVEGERQRRGENDLSTEAPRDGNVGRSFPLGTVEKCWTARVGAEWVLAPYAEAALEAAWHDFENYARRPGISEEVLELRFALTLRSPAWTLASQ